MAGKSTWKGRVPGERVSIAVLDGGYDAFAILKHQGPGKRLFQFATVLLVTEACKDDHLGPLVLLALSGSQEVVCRHLAHVSDEWGYYVDEATFRAAYARGYHNALYGVREEDCHANEH